MERFYVNFYMNNGKSVEIVEEQEENYNYKIAFEQNKKWFKCGFNIINLDNVNYVTVETETERKKISAAMENIRF